MLSSGRLKHGLLLGAILMAGIFGIAPAQQTSPATTPSPTPAPGLFAGPLESRQLGSYGNWAQGFYGDYLLSNKHLKATISNTAQENNIFPSGGFLLDLARTALPMDYFSYFNMVAESPSQRKIAYTKSEFVETGYPGGAKALVLTGHVDRNEKLTVKTEYILGPETRYLRVITTFKNDTGAAIDKFNAFDEVNWGALVVFIPSQGFLTGSIAGAQSDWVGGFMDDLSIVLGAPQANAPLIITHNQTTSQVYYQSNPEKLENGKEKKFERLLYVGDGNTASVAGELYQTKRIPLGIVSGSMIEIGTNQPIPNTEIRILQSRDEKGEHVPTRPFAKAQTDDRGRFSIRLPKGSYFILPNPIGRTRENLTLSVDVLPNRTTVLELKASPPVYLNYNVVDADTKQPIPSKLTFVSIDKPPSNFGPPYKADGARNTTYAPSGNGRVQIEPGFYGVFISRGIEYNIAKREIEVKATGENQLTVELKREMPVNGYISIDFGVRTANSWDTPVTERDRVISAAAEGVDILVTGDANKATNLKPLIVELGLQNQLNAITGMRVEYDKKEVPGNFLLFPVPDTASAKAADLLNTTSGEALFKATAQAFPAAEGSPQTMIAVMRPNMPYEGYFKNAGWDSETGQFSGAKTLSYDFDFLDIWEGKRQGVLDMNNALFMWMNYNNRFPGIIGGTNSHLLFGEETGYPRVYVQSSTDNPAQVNVSELLANLKAGKVIITNGPWIEVKINGKGLGEIASDTDGDSIVEFDLKVNAPTWVQTDFIDVMGDGMFRKRIIRRSYNTTQHYPAPNKMDESKFRMRIHRDMIIQIKVVGERGLEPVVTKYGAGEEEYVRPYAISGPIYLDIDGDGVCKLPQDFSKRAE